MTDQTANDEQTGEAVEQPQTDQPQTDQPQGEGFPQRHEGFPGGERPEGFPPGPPPGGFGEHGPGHGHGHGHGGPPPGWDDQRGEQGGAEQQA